MLEMFFVIYENDWRWSMREVFIRDWPLSILFWRFSFMFILCSWIFAFEWKLMYFMWWSCWWMPYLLGLFDDMLKFQVVIGFAMKWCQGALGSVTWNIFILNCVLRSPRCWFIITVQRFDSVNSAVFELIWTETVIVLLPCSLHVKGTNEPNITKFLFWLTCTSSLSLNSFFRPPMSETERFVLPGSGRDDFELCVSSKEVALVHT